VEYRTYPGAPTRPSLVPAAATRWRGRPRGSPAPPMAAPAARF